MLFLAKTRRDLEPAARLELFRTELQSLLGAEEFRSFLGLFTKDSARNRFVEQLLVRFKEKDCRPYLSQTSKQYEEICQQPSLATLSSCRGDVLVAVLRYGAKAKEFLTAMLEQEARITQLAASTGERLSAKDIRVLCLRTPRKADALESSLALRCIRQKNG